MRDTLEQQDLLPYGCGVAFFSHFGSDAELGGSTPPRSAFFLFLFLVAFVCSFFFFCSPFSLFMSVHEAVEQGADHGMGRAGRQGSKSGKEQHGMQYSKWPFYLRFK